MTPPLAVMTELPAVSVVIVSRDRRPDLLACLESLRRVREPALEIVVVDDFSRDASLEAVAAAFPDGTLPVVRRYALNRPAGTGRARNLGARLARGKYLWFLDSDAVLLDAAAPARWLAACAADPSLGGIGGEAVLDGAGRVVAAKRLSPLPNGLIRSDTPAIATGWLTAERLATCNLFMPSEAFAAIGGFDPAFVFHLEDMDLTARLRRAGYRLAIPARVPVEHRFSPRARRRNPLPARIARALFLLKHATLAEIAALPLHDVAFLAAPERWGKLFTRLSSGKGSGEESMAMAAASPRPPGGGLIDAVLTAVSLPVTYVALAALCRQGLALRRHQDGSLAGDDPDEWVRPA